MRLFDLAFEALVYMFEHRNQLWRLGIAPAILVFLFAISFSLITPTEIFGLANESLIGASQIVVIQSILFLILFLILIGLIIVMWHRQIILDEKIWENWRYLIPNTIVYLLRTLIITTIVLPLAIPLYFLYDGILTKDIDYFFLSTFLLQIISFFLATIVTTVVLRLSPYLVEAAIGRKSRGIMWSWRMTPQLTGQFFGVALVEGVIVTVGDFFMMLMSAIPAGGIVSLLLIAGTTTIFSLLQAFLLASAISLAYRRLSPAEPVA